MGNKISRKKTKPSLRKRPVSRDPSSLHSIEEARKSLEPNIGEEMKNCTAMFDFSGYHECDLDFKKGDLFYNVRSLRDRTDWCLATHSERRERGFIPRDYVCEDSVPNYYKDFSKSEVERLLLKNEVSEGTYIISQRNRESYTLDVRYDEVTSSETEARRVTYKIRQGRDNRLYIVPRKQFDTVTELLQYYRENPAGMRCALKDCLPPCVHTVAARDLDIKEDSFQTLDRLGNGLYGDVFQGLLKKKLPVAVRIVDVCKLGITAKTLVEELKKVSSAHRHRRFVQMLGVSCVQDTVFVISELMVGGSLREYLRNDQGETIHFLQCVDIAKQVCEGMCFLENHEQSYRCLLTCGNILVGTNLQIKIKTFPLAKEQKTGDLAEIHERGYRRWRAPEYIVSSTFTPTSDVWSYGVLLYEIITFGRLPFTEVEPREFLGTIQKGYKMGKPPSPIPYDEDFWYDVMLQCLELLPESRPTFEKLQDIFEDHMLRLRDNPSYS